MQNDITTADVQERKIYLEDYSYARLGSLLRELGDRPKDMPKTKRDRINRVAQLEFGDAAIPTYGVKHLTAAEITNKLKWAIECNYRPILVSQLSKLKASRVILYIKLNRSTADLIEQAQALIVKYSDSILEVTDIEGVPNSPQIHRICQQVTGRG